jgi:hypothetical protein
LIQKEIINIYHLEILLIKQEEIVIQMKKEMMYYQEKLEDYHYLDKVDYQCYFKI